MSDAHYVYLLRCADQSLYTGYTTDLSHRVAAHNSGVGAKYTRSRRPVALAQAWAVPTRSVGLRLEAAIKKLTHDQKERLVADAPSPEELIQRLLD
ncbi:MAG: GIY-YIG nuclease family protein [Peptoniphilaceae bacterium]|nr:GIY-YIG nuclease family protein [Peptoniphilaceae bacterium]MDY6085988.1 GIY-YIG nuclease family protein [Peptoniphilaceae bacterium]